MEIKRGYRSYRCVAVVQPGEYMISAWDHKQCLETNPAYIIRCEVCHKPYCLRHSDKHTCEGE